MVNIIYAMNMESQNGLVWFGLEGALKIILFHPLLWPGTLSTVPSYSKPCPTCSWTLQGSRGSHSFSGHLCQGLSTLTVKDFFLISDLNLLSFSVNAFHCLLVVQYIRFCIKLYRETCKLAHCTVVLFVDFLAYVTSLKCPF